MKPSARLTFFIVAAGCLLLPTPLLGYGGPGSIVSGVGAFLALLAAIGAALFGFFWYPGKRLVRMVRDRRPKSGPPTRSDVTE